MNVILKTVKIIFRLLLHKEAYHQDNFKPLFLHSCHQYLH